MAGKLLLLLYFCSKQTWNRIFYLEEQNKATEGKPVKLVGAQQVDCLVEFVDGQQVGRRFQVLLLQTQLLDEGLHCPAPHHKPSWRSK